MKIAIGNDHTAIELKNIIREFVKERAMRSLTWEPIPPRAATTPYTGKR